MSIDLRRVLCPTDFSPCAASATRLARELARAFSAELDVLHVVPSSRAPGAELLDALFARPAAGGRLMDDLDAVAAAARADGVACGTLLREGDPAANIVAAAEDLETDLVVMGARGGLGGAAYFLGSVAEKVLRTAPCPVLTVSSSAQTPPGASCRRVLCALDFSSSSPDTLAHASAVARHTGAELLLVHVLEGEALASPPLPLGFDLEGLRSWMEESARERLIGALTEAHLGECSSRAQVAWGKPYREIVRIALAEACDLIVTGVRGSSPLQYGLFGSTANQVVRLAPCPVLTVRPRLPRRRHEPMVDEQELAGRR